MSLSALETKMRTTPPTGRFQWGLPEAAVEVLNDTLNGLVVGASTAAADPGSDATQAFAVQGVTGGKALVVSATALTAMAAAIGATTDLSSADTVIGLLKAIKENTGA